MTRLGAALCLLALTIVTVESVSRPSAARKPPRAPRRQEEPLAQTEEEPLAQAGEEPLAQGEGEVKQQPVWLKMEAADPNLQQPGSGAAADEDEDAGAAVLAGEVQEIAPELPDVAQAEGEGNIQDLDVEGTGGQDASGPAAAAAAADAKTPPASWFPSTRCSAGVQHTTPATLPEVSADADDGDSPAPLSKATSPADDTTMAPALTTTTTTTTTRAPYIGPGAARPPDHYLDDV